MQKNKWEEVVEGKTKLLVPKKGKFGLTEKGKHRKPPVFYNPRAKLSRDICCGVVKALMRREEISFLDALAGSGARGIRIAKEAGCEVHLNDANPDACQIIKKNAGLNNLKVNVSNKNANLFFQENVSIFNFIDIDPFGTPVSFLENAVLSAKGNGYLGITATDGASLCGVYPKACIRKYSALPLRCEFCHETAIRILLGHIAKVAAKYSKGMWCLLSHSTEHYFRTYVQLLDGKKKANKSLSELGYVYYCRHCLNREFKKEFLPSLNTCECGRSYEIGGPLWLGRIKDSGFCIEVGEEIAYLKDKRTEKLIDLISKEADAPFYYDVHLLSKNLKINALPIKKLIEKLNATRTHFSLTGIKTEASIKDVKKDITSLLPLNKTRTTLQLYHRI